MRIPVLLLLLAVMASTARADEPRSYYLIGNSLTWDTVPSRLDGTVRWHVDCGKSLPYIHAHPEEPCIKTSTLWPEALADGAYDFVSVQTHYGATLAEDADVVSRWIAMQPKATFVIHTGWAHHEKRAAEWARTDAKGRMQHSRAYIDALLAELRKRHPETTFRETRAIDLLNHVAEDVAKGTGPLESVADLHRDAIHVKVDSGRYLMHNAMRHALGQPRSAAGFETLDPELKQYLDGLLDRLPKP